MPIQSQIAVAAAPAASHIQYKTEILCKLKKAALTLRMTEAYNAQARKLLGCVGERVQPKANACSSSWHLPSGVRDIHEDINI